MNNAVGRLAYALDASREEQGLCPHEKNPAFDAGMFIIGSGWQTAVCPVRGLSGSRFVRLASTKRRLFKVAPRMPVIIGSFRQIKRKPDLAENLLANSDNYPV